MIAFLKEYYFDCQIFVLKVKLTLQKLAVECEPEPMMNRKNNLINESLVRLMRGDENQEEADIPAILTRLPHVVLYLTLDVASDTMADRVSRRPV